MTWLFFNIKSKSVFYFSLLFFLRRLPNNNEPKPATNEPNNNPLFC